MGLAVVGERAADGSLLAHDGEEVRLTQARTTLVLGDAAPSGYLHPGTLYITTKRLAWLSDASLQTGYAVDLRFLTVHAVSRDLESFPQPCIYAQIYSEDDEDGDMHESDEEEVDDDRQGAAAQPPAGANGVMGNVTGVAEIRFIPEDPSLLNHIFGVLSECAALNPDMEEDGEGEWYYNEEELVENDPDRFEDADDEEDEHHHQHRQDP
eukprot:jgi/Chlat1/170/Chrsp1S00230